MNISRRKISLLGGVFVLEYIFNIQKIGAIEKVKSRYLLIPGGPRDEKLNAGFFLGRFHLDSGKLENIAMSFLGHGIAFHPIHSNIAIIFGKRHSPSAALIDLEKFRVLKTITVNDGVYFYGHGCFDPSGKTFFASEGTSDSVVVVEREYPTFKQISKLTHKNVSAHDITYSKQHESLFVANAHIEKLGKQSVSSITGIKWTIKDNETSYLFTDQDASLEHILPIDPNYLGVAIVNTKSEGDLAAICELKSNTFVGLTVPVYVRKTMGDRGLSLAVDNKRKIIAMTCPNGKAVIFWSIISRKYLGRAQVDSPQGIVYDFIGDQYIATLYNGSIVSIDPMNFKVNQRWNLLNVNQKWESHIYISPAKLS